MCEMVLQFTDNTHTHPLVQGKITEVDTSTIQMGATPSVLISGPPPSSPHFLHQMSFLPQPSHFILAWDRHQICWLAYPVVWLVIPSGVVMNYVISN